MKIIEALQTMIKARREKFVKLTGKSTKITTLDYKIEVRERLKIIDKTVGPLGKNLVQKSSDGTKDVFGELDSALAIMFGSKDLSAIQRWVDGTTEHPPRLKHCNFTPIRPGMTVEAKSARRRHRSGRVEGRDFLEEPLGLLDSILQMTLRDGASDVSVDDHLRDLTARLQALDGIYGAVLTGALNAALEGIEKDWRLWWQDWQESPPHRAAAFELIPQPAVRQYISASERSARERIALPRRYVRYRLINVITNLDTAIHTTAPEKTGEELCSAGSGSASRPAKTAKTGMRAFDTFIKAVLSQRLVDEKTGRLHNGRRFYTVAAQRGLGKGSFHSVFMTKLGLTAYLRAAHPRPWRVLGEGPDIESCFLGAISINLSVRPESC